MSNEYNVTMTIDKDLLRETLIALRDRESALRKESARYIGNDTVLAIVRSQISRTTQARMAVEEALGERF